MNENEMTRQMAREKKAKKWFPFVYCIESRVEKAVITAIVTEECQKLYPQGMREAVKCAREKADYSTIVAKCARLVCLSSSRDVTSHSLLLDWPERNGCFEMR